MTLLIEYELAINSTVTGLMTMFLIVQWRDAMFGIRDALYRNMLPFMWVICAVVAAESVFVSGPLDFIDDKPLEVAFDAAMAAVWSAVGVQWYQRWKNSDDDTWKKRRRKIMEKIEALNGRLVPVPVTT